MLNHGHVYEVTIPADAHGRGLADWLAARFVHSSPAVWAARLAAGELTTARGPLGPDAVARRGEVVRWRRPPWEEDPVPRTYTRVHEDADVLVVHKPAGLPTMPSGGFLEGTLLALVRADVPGAVPMHRLGTGTSGLVVFARNAEAARPLQAAWRAHDVAKDYLAVVQGLPEPAEQDIHTPIGPVPHPLLGTVHAANPTGRSASSHLRVLAPHARGTLVAVRITTGRPHQIRIHTASIGHPLHGDPLYLPGGHARADARPTEGGYLLHAHRVAFPHPRTGVEVALTCAPPWAELA